MTYFMVEDERLRQGSAPPANAQPISAAGKAALPSIVAELHHQFRGWGAIGLSPGPILPATTWVSPAGKLAFEFTQGKQPAPLTPNVGQAPDLAAWLVLLDKFVDTFVVVARARSEWSANELGGALSFATPAFLPLGLTAHPPDNWQRVARELAHAIADTPITGGTNGRYRA